MRRERLVGGVLIVLGLTLLGIFWQVQSYSADVADQFVALGGDCTAGGTCLHQAATNWLLIGAVPSVLIILAGVYVLLYLRVSTAGDKIKREKAFSLLLQGLTVEERRVMGIVRDEEGITQSTLKYRADLSKSKLSQVLSDLEKRGLVAREESGNTKKIYLGSATSTEVTEQK